MDQDQNQDQNELSVDSVDSVDTEDVYEPDNLAVCERCGTTATTDSEEYVDTWQHLIDPDGELWCGECVDDYAIACADCGGFVRAARRWFVRINGEEEAVCQSCYDDNFARCQVCGEACPTRELRPRGGLDSVCNSCWEDSYVCDDCGDRVWDNNEGHDCTYSDSDDDCDGVIHDYGYDVMRELKFLGKPKDGLYLGVELEVECRGGSYRTDRGEMAETVADAMKGFAVLKSDGSLDYGFEIVTAPATIEVHREEWDKRFYGKSWLSSLSSWDAGTCGLHVHISRKPLSKLTITKMAAFCNKPENKPFLCKLAGRWNSSYARFRPEPKRSRYLRRSSEHYDILNLANDNTIELRMFRGSLRPERLWRALEFSHSLVKFCQQAGLEQLDSKDYLRWLEGSKKKYPALAEFYFPKAPLTLEQEVKARARREGLQKQEVLQLRQQLTAVVDKGVTPITPRVLGLGDHGETTEQEAARWLENERVMEQEAAAERERVAAALEQRRMWEAAEQAAAEARRQEELNSAERQYREEVVRLAPVDERYVAALRERYTELYHRDWHVTDEWIAEEATRDQERYLERGLRVCDCRDCRFYSDVQQRLYEERKAEEERQRQQRHEQRWQELVDSLNLMSVVERESRVNWNYRIIPMREIVDQYPTPYEDANNRDQDFWA